MKKRLKALLIALVLLVTSVISINGDYIVANAANDGITVNFHFTGASSYDDYRLWLWTIGDDGWEAKMTAGANEATYAMQTETSTLKIGYIVKKGDGWEGKDYDADRFIDLSKYVSGTVEVYITSKVGKVTIDDSKAVTGLKLTSAKTEDLENITFTSAVDIPDVNALNLKIKNTTDDTYETIKSVSGSGTSFTITVAQKLNNLKSYEIEYLDGMTFMVSLPDVYSNDEFEGKYTYTGNDLGATWSASKTDFRVWAPLATAVSINLYQSGTAGTDDKISTTPMTADVNGTWVASIDGDLNGIYYTYTATVNGKVVEDIIDPYARTSGVNGNRGMIIDLDSTDPEGWANDKSPATSANYVDDVLYELHIRDFSIDASSGMKNKGKYLAFTEKGTVNSYGQSTGIDYLKDLGVTHVHLLPTFDYASVDETKLDTPQYNWGYDPQNFNIPEGSYSTDPYNGAVRVNEFKQMVQALHNEGISVVMDVVYGHVNSASDFSISKLTPNYYSRPNSSASGCGNDTATERSMNRKYIVDSVVYWATEYHIDGFRIDQEGLFDTDTINGMTEALHAINPNIIVYGEGWDMSSTKPTKTGVTLSNQGAAGETLGSAYFSDGIRDSLKGSVFDTTPGYVTGGFAKLSSVLDAIIANPGWQWNPNQVVNYNSCHDNYTLFDRITITDGNTETSFADRVKQNNLAAAIVFSSQGVPFIQAGEEILRTKPNGDGTYEENSYCSPDAINSIKWDTLNEAAYATTHDYYKGLIAFRKAHAGLRMTNEEDIENNLQFLYEEKRDDNAIAYQIAGGANGEASDGIVVVYNPSNEKINVDLPDGEWGIYVQGDKAGNELLGTATGSVSVDAVSCTILVKGNKANTDTNGNGNGNGNAAKDDNAAIVKTGDSSTRTIMFIGIGVVALAVVTVLVAKRKKELN